jgi:Flp pilus assembly protein TadG
LAALSQLSPVQFTAGLAASMQMAAQPKQVTVMLSAPTPSHLRQAARGFLNADGGNLAIIFAFALIPLVSLMGAAIDYTRANAARSSMQAALDSTTLMMSKDLSQGALKPSDVNATTATNYFTALYTNKDAKGVSINATYTAASGSTPATILATGSGYINSDFMQIAGFPTLSFDANSTSTWGNVKMRVAMVLDNTGSMEDDGKMPAMQQASKNLVDQLSQLALSPGDVYISIVPFSKDVNVGASNYNASWIDWSVWDTLHGTCTVSNKHKQSTCQSAGGTWTHANHSTWNGCVMDRAQNNDVTNTPPSLADDTTKFPAEQYAYCNGNALQPIMPLTYNWGALKTMIDAMQPTDTTNQGIGLAWGWETLTQGAPENPPAEDSTSVYQKAIILLSDGLNTENRFTSDPSQIDARQALLCQNAKNAGIVLYTIQVNTSVPADPTSTVLQQCASSPDKFYLLTSASQVVTAFNNIGTSLSKLRVAR